MTNVSMWSLWQCLPPRYQLTTNMEETRVLKFKDADISLEPQKESKKCKKSTRTNKPSKVSEDVDNRSLPPFPRRTSGYVTHLKSQALVTTMKTTFSQAPAFTSSGKKSQFKTEVSGMQQKATLLSAPHSAASRRLGDIKFMKNINHQYETTNHKLIDAYRYGDTNEIRALYLAKSAQIKPSNGMLQKHLLDQFPQKRPYTVGPTNKSVSFRDVVVEENVLSDLKVLPTLSEQHLVQQSLDVNLDNCEYDLSQANPFGSNESLNFEFYNDFDDRKLKEYNITTNELLRYYDGNNVGENISAYQSYLMNHTKYPEIQSSDETVKKTRKNINLIQFSSLTNREISDTAIPIGDELEENNSFIKFHNPVRLSPRRQQQKLHISPRRFKPNKNDQQKDFDITAKKVNVNTRPSANRDHRSDENNGKETLNEAVIKDQAKENTLVVFSGDKTFEVPTVMGTVGPTEELIQSTRAQVAVEQPGDDGIVTIPVGTQVETEKNDDSHSGEWAKSNNSVTSKIVTEATT